MSFDQQLQMQQKKIDDLLAQVEDLRLKKASSYDAGDRIDYAFNDAVTFAQGSNPAQNIVFTIPEQTTVFEAERLSLYAGYRLVSTDPATDGVDEAAFRPCAFTWYSEALNRGIDTASAVGLVDMFVEISETYYLDGRAITRSYQNLPIPSELFFSGAVNYQQMTLAGGAAANAFFNCFEFPSALIFPCPYLLTGGSSVTIRLAPTFAGLRTDPQTSTQNEYQVRALLEGKKVVR
jgi:hypothetical protein